MQVRRVFAVDPGAVHFGWAILDLEFDQSNNLYPNLLHSGCETFDFNSRGEFQKRLPLACMLAGSLFSSFVEKYDVDVFAYEMMPPVFTGTNMAQRMLSLSVLASCLSRCEIDTHPIAANSVKKFMTGNGKATKAKVKRAIIDNYFPDLKGEKYLEDQWDAIAIGITCLMKKNDEE